VKQIQQRKQEVTMRASRLAKRACELGQDGWFENIVLHDRLSMGVSLSALQSYDWSWQNTTVHNAWWPSRM